MSTPLPHQGRHPGIPPPVSLAYPPDPPTPLPIYLSIDIPEPYLARDTLTRDFHWSIYWTVGVSQGNECCRLLSLETYNNEHLVYYGAFTKVKVKVEQGVGMGLGLGMGGNGNKNKAYALGFATLRQRKLLEQIASETDVMMPDGEWNCQDWVKSVLATACDSESVLATACARDSVSMSAKACDSGLATSTTCARDRGIFDPEVVRRAVSSAEALPPVLRKIPPVERSCSA